MGEIGNLIKELWIKMEDSTLLRLVDTTLLMSYGGIITWLLTTIIDGDNIIRENNKMILWTEIILLSLLTLYGVIRWIQVITAARRK